VFEDFDLLRVSSNIYSLSVSIIAISANLPSSILPLSLRFRILAGLKDVSFTKSFNVITLSLTRFNESGTRVCNPIMPKAARSNSTNFSSIW